MTRQMNFVYTILLVVLLVWLLAGCADRSGDGGGQQPGASHEGSSASGIWKVHAGPSPVKEDMSGKMIFGLDDGIWTMNADGSDLAQLHGPFVDPANTDESPLAPSPSWLPDGNKIAFIKTSRKCAEEESSAKATGSASAEPTAPPPCAFVMDANGSNQEQLLDLPVRALSFSPDGEKIAYVTESSEIYVTNADGSGTPDKITNGYYGSPEWSPDGEKIAFTGGPPDDVKDIISNIYVAKVSHAEGDTNHTQNLTDNNSAIVTELSWSPDGAEIAFSGSRDYAGTDIYKMNANGSGMIRLTDSPDPESYPSWSPDGKDIAYIKTDRYERNRTGIYVVNSDGSNPTLIKKLHPTNMWAPAEADSLDWR